MLDSMKTPSYPSGRDIQGYLLGEILSKRQHQILMNINKLVKM